MSDIQYQNESPLYGKWHHGNGVLVCGSVRVAVADFDSNPSDEVKKEIFDWICKSLNNNCVSQFKKINGGV
jgi:hypothetical protein